MIGVAFSLGFTLGPLMGAYFALRLKDAEVFYQGPAMLAVLFSLADLLFIFFMLPETLQKVSNVTIFNTQRLTFKYYHLVTKIMIGICNLPFQVHCNNIMYNMSFSMN